MFIFEPAGREGAAAAELVLEGAKRLPPPPPPLTNLGAFVAFEAKAEETEEPAMLLALLLPPPAPIAEDCFESDCFAEEGVFFGRRRALEVGAAEVEEDGAGAAEEELPAPPNFEGAAFELLPPPPPTGLETEAEAEAEADDVEELFLLLSSFFFFLSPFFCFFFLFLFFFFSSSVLFSSG